MGGGGVTITIVNYFPTNRKIIFLKVKGVEGSMETSNIKHRTSFLNSIRTCAVKRFFPLRCLILHSITQYL